MNRDPSPANDDAFFRAPEPKTLPKKFGRKRLALVALGLLLLAILGNFLRQPVADYIEFQMLPRATKDALQEIPPDGYCRCRVGIEINSGKAVIEIPSLQRSDLAILSSDNENIERTIKDAFCYGIFEEEEGKESINRYSFLPRWDVLELGSPPNDAKIIAAIRPLLPEIESLRQAANEHVIIGIGIDPHDGKTVVETENRGSRHLYILSLDNKRVDETIKDAYWIKSINEVVDVNARFDEYLFLRESSYFVRCGQTLSEVELINAITPFLPELEPRRKQVLKNGKKE